MPIFEFQREDCGEVFEELILGNDSDKVICKKCKSSNVKKLISQVSFKSDNKFTSSVGSACSTCKGGTCSGCH